MSLLLAIGVLTLFHFVNLMSVHAQAIGPANPASREDRALLDRKFASLRTADTSTLEAQRLARLKDCIEPESLQKAVASVYEEFDKDPAARTTMLAYSGYELVKDEIFRGWSMTAATVAQIKMFSYDLGTKKASLAEGIGVGIPIQVHGGNVHAIKRECRTRSYRFATDDADKRLVLGNHWFSLTPTIFFKAAADDTNVTEQPAIVLSFWNDILHFGTGFNLSGPNQGNVFLVFGIGTNVPGQIK